MAVSFDSPYYPYEKVQEGFLTMRGSEWIPYKILNYLLDLPDDNGYEPFDDNERPRVRLAKYLWYDGPRPLDNVLPTPTEKMSIFYDGDVPVLNTDIDKKRHPKGYRIFPVGYFLQAELTAKTVLKCWIGKVQPLDFTAKIGLNFQIVVNTDFDSTTRTEAFSRAYNIEQCVIESLNGVNITGIGTVRYSRASFIDDGSKYQWDEGTHIYRSPSMSIDWAESDMGVIHSY